MFTYIRALIQRHFSDPQVIMLALLLLAAATAIMLLGKILAPVLASIVIAYLLDGLVGALRKRNVPAPMSVYLVFMLFVTGLLFVSFALIPLLYRQTTQLILELPGMIAQGQQFLLLLPERYPAFVSEEQIRELIQGIRFEVGKLGERVFSLSLVILPTLLGIIIYLVLMPLLVFFFLKDKEKILAWLAAYLPRDRSLAIRVWRETNQQVANYIRGKFWEILIVGLVSYATFKILGLDFAVLLAALVGFSVVIPYIGATVVTFPVALVAYFQWGWGAELAYVMIAYAIIQALDANVLVPLLFSKVVNLHPVAIIVAVLFFGGIWGFWGVFFAIPLATLIKAVLSAWPRSQELSGRAGEAEAGGSAESEQAKSLATAQE